jgi:hypothetical protein
MQGGYRLEIIDGSLSHLMETRRTSSSSSSSCLCDSHNSIMQEKNRTWIMNDHRVRHCTGTTTFLQNQNDDMRNANTVSNRFEGSEAPNDVATPFLSNLNSLRHVLLNHTDLKETNNSSGVTQTQGTPPPAVTRIACKARGMPSDHTLQVCTMRYSV